MMLSATPAMSPSSAADPSENPDPAQRTKTTLAAAREIAASLSERAAPQPMMA